jgi:RNA polymerase sigma-70 factor (ECF subfamily)
VEKTPLTLLERLRQPNQPDAWARFVELYTPWLLYWARRKGLSDQDAADLVQEVFVLLVQKLPEFRHDGVHTFRGWLRALTVNKWRDRMRRAKLPMAGPHEESLSGIRDPEANGVEALWDQEERQHLVRRALEIMQVEFSPTTWQACWEFVVEEKSATEVAAHLGISENAVYIAKCRVLGRLRRELEGLLD